MHSLQSEIKLTLASKTRSSIVKVKIFGGNFPISGLSKSKLTAQVELLYNQGSLGLSLSLKTIELGKPFSSMTCLEAYPCIFPK